MQHLDTERLAALADERFLVADTVEYPIQVNGKVRSRITLPAEATVDDVRAAALAASADVAIVRNNQPFTLTLFTAPGGGGGGGAGLVASGATIPPAVEPPARN